MVVTSFPAARDTAATQDRTASPSICTVQAPHCAMPQPYFVPVRPIVSRSTHNSGVRGSTSAWYGLPLTLRDTIAVLPLRLKALKPAQSALGLILGLNASDAVSL